MKDIISNCVIAFLVIMNICVGIMIYTGIQPKCFVDGCNCARIGKGYYCHKHSSDAYYELADNNAVPGITVEFLDDTLRNDICLNVRNRN